MLFAFNKKILVIVAHQDDESLFCGGLLTNIYTKSLLVIVCMSEAKYKSGIVHRNNDFKKVCKRLGARAIVTNFKDSDQILQGLENFYKKRGNQIDDMKQFLNGLKEKYKPDLVITHNEFGEYGHCYHKVINKLCKETFNNLYFFGIGNKNRGKTIKIEYDPRRKKELLDIYRFNGKKFSENHFGTDITKDRETYIVGGIFDKNYL